MRRGCGHGIDDCPTSCMEALSEMASEIDEAAAVEWAGVVLWSETVMSEDRNLARAALRWKSRAEAAEAERDELRQAVKSLTKLADLAEVSR